MPNDRPPDPTRGGLAGSWEGEGAATTGRGLAGRLPPAMGRALIGLDAHQLVVAAMKRSGRDEFGPRTWSEPLERLCTSLRRDAHLHSEGRWRARRLIVELLARRAAWPHGVADPGPADRERLRTAPVVITGLPGSGADLLARRLASTTDHRPLPRTEAELVDDLRSLRFDAAWHVPSFAEWLDGADLTDTYAELARRADRRRSGPWLLSGACHLERLGDLRAACPHAVIVAVRPPDEEALVHAWATDIIAERARWSDRVDPDAVRRYWSWRAGCMIERADRVIAEGGITVPDPEAVATDPDRVVSEISALADVDS